MYITSIAVGTELVINGQSVKVLDANSKHVKFGITPPAGCNFALVPQPPQSRRIVLTIERKGI